MKTPTPENFEGFFHGMAHALSVAESRKRGRVSAQVQAIRREMITLSLLHDQFVRNQSRQIPATEVRT